MDQLFLRKTSFNFKAAIVSKYKSLCDQIWPWRKMGQGQPREIIWTILVVFTYTMLHTKFQGHWSDSWFWRRRFFKVFTIYGHGGHLGHVTQLICIYFHSYSPSSFHMNFGSKLPNCFWEKQVWTLKSEWPLTKVKEWPWPWILTQLHKLI